MQKKVPSVLFYRYYNLFLANDRSVENEIWHSHKHRVTKKVPRVSAVILVSTCSPMLSLSGILIFSCANLRHFQLSHFLVDTTALRCGCGAPPARPGLTGPPTISETNKVRKTPVWWLVGAVVTYLVTKFCWPRSISSRSNEVIEVKFRLCRVAVGNCRDNASRCREWSKSDLKSWGEGPKQRSPKFLGQGHSRSLTYDVIKLHIAYNS